MQECRPDRVEDCALADIEVEDPGERPLKVAAPTEAVKPAKIYASISRRAYGVGAAWALFAISIWAGWFVSSRFNITTNLTAYDLVALRFGVAGVFLLPLTIRMRAGLGRVSPANLVLLFIGSGAIYSLAITGGVAFSPAAEGAALMPGVMPMATALLSVLILKERLRSAQLLGFAFILIGILTIAGFGLFHAVHQEWLGHLLFLAAAFLFASYTIGLRRSGLSGLQASAIVSFFSCLLYLPVYFLALHPKIFDVPVESLLFPAFYQGVLTNIVSLIAYGRAVALLGAPGASAFAALVPAITLLLGIPFLGEFPSVADCIGIAAVSLGVFMTSRVATSPGMLQK